MGDTRKRTIGVRCSSSHARQRSCSHCHVQPMGDPSAIPGAYGSHFQDDLLVSHALATVSRIECIVEPRVVDHADGCVKSGHVRCVHKVRTRSVVVKSRVVHSGKLKFESVPASRRVSAPYPNTV
jgi:hypothetical protein